MNHPEQKRFEDLCRKHLRALKQQGSKVSNERLAQRFAARVEAKTGHPPH